MMKLDPRFLPVVLALLTSIAHPVRAGASPSYASLGEMMLASCDAAPTKNVFTVKRGDRWVATTYGRWASESRKLAAWMLQRGIGRGDRVAILSYNDPTWATVDLACQMIGAVVVPLYPALTGPQHDAIVRRTGAKVLFVMDRVHLDAIPIKPGAPGAVTVVGMLGVDCWPKPSERKLKEIGVESVPQEWPAGAVALPPILQGPEVDAAGVKAIRERTSQVGRDDLATICFTSGTTSAPAAGADPMTTTGKGVMLTHGNILSNVEAVSGLVSLGPDDVILSVLPLAHMFERTCGYYCAVYRGASIGYASSPAGFLDDMKAIRPTLFTCVPLLLEKLQQRMQAMADGRVLSAITHSVEIAAGAVGACGERVDQIKWRAFGRMLRSKIGGRLRFAIAGGAALSRTLAEFLQNSCDLLVLEGYGLTETSPVLTGNRPEAYRFGTVGKPISGVEIRLAEDGEILARGPGIMKGYLDDPQETAKAIDAAGWFHTGDTGAFDADGFLSITGRKKSVFKLSTGKYVNPDPIESRMSSALVNQTLVCGENQAVAGMVIFPNLEALRALAKSKGVQGSDADLCAHATIRAAYDKLVKDACAGLADHETVKVFVIVPAVLTIDGGELTPTLKLKRAVVANKFKPQIDAMFAGYAGH